MHDFGCFLNWEKLLTKGFAHNIRSNWPQEVRCTCKVCEYCLELTEFTMSGYFSMFSFWWQVFLSLLAKQHTFSSLFSRRCRKTRGLSQSAWSWERYCSLYACIPAIAPCSSDYYHHDTQFAILICLGWERQLEDEFEEEGCGGCQRQRDCFTLCVCTQT